MALLLAGALLQACGSEVEQPSGSGEASSGEASGGGGGSSSGDGGAGGSTTSGGGGSAGSASSGSGSGSGLVDPIELAGDYDDTASSLALGPTDVYWANFSILGDNKYEYGVKTAPKEPGAEAYEVEGIWALAVAVDASHVYFTDGFSVSKKPLGGGSITQLATGQAIEAGASIAVDDESVYWPNRNLGTVMKAAKDGSSMETVASGQASPMRVALDDTHVYWVNTVDPGAVMSTPKSGGAPESIADNQHGPSALAVGPAHVAWTTTGDQTIWLAQKGGGQATKIASGHFSTAIALDDKHIYWLRSDTGAVRAPVGGGPTTTLSVGQTGCSEIALDDGFVYWTRNAVTKGSKVLKLPK